MATGAGVHLDWLTASDGWRERLTQVRNSANPDWSEIALLSQQALDFVAMNAVDGVMRRIWPAGPADATIRKIRLGIVASCTVSHLLPAIRLGGLRRGIWMDIHEAAFGQYQQEILDPNSALRTFKPDVVLFCFDARHLAAGIRADADEASVEAELNAFCLRLAGLWRTMRDDAGCAIVQQTVLNPYPALLGSNEHRLPGSRAHYVRRLNQSLRALADAHGAHVLALDAAAERDGLSSWHDEALWHRSKQDVTPVAAPMYGELLGRLIGAAQGLSRKALVLDLDNTLWGGVVGDDGLDGIVVGQGSAAGEAFLALQDYALEQARRGVILAVCSKNDEANAIEVFEKHPEMLLRRKDISCFVANWDDKATNLRRIAQQLNIGIDSLVFVDDNPFERNLVRQELPMVAVPEIPDDPALVPIVLARAGYFEGTAVTAEDRQRGELYRANAERMSALAEGTDLPSYLKSLEMRLIWQPFDRISFQRTHQLINKTNQFNLTTRRYSEAEVEQVIADPAAFGINFRLLDRFGDNGIIAIIIGRLTQPGEAVLLDTWLMSCRVLGRQVEEACLNVVAEEARRLGAKQLLGEYVPTAKNRMVERHYQNLGFAVLHETAENGSQCMLELDGFEPRPTFMTVTRG